MAPRPVTIYGESKLLGEVFLRNICANKIFWTIIRPGGVYGPKDKDIFLYFKAINRGWKILPSGKKRIIPLIHAQDLAELCYSAAEKSASGEIYLATDSGTHTWVSVADAIARILNKKGVRIVIPLTITSAVAFASELRGKLQGKLSPLNREKLKELRANWGASMAKAQHILNFKSAFTLEAGLRNTVEWYLAHGWLRP
jgi:nucleoside-diphosphate-sugar epimerase